MRVRVTSIEHEFTALPDFLRYLEDGGEPEVGDILLLDDGLNEEDFKKLMLFLYRNAIPPRHVLVSAEHPHAEAYNQILHNIFLANQRYQIEQHAPEHEAKSVAQPPESRMRKAKLDLVRGKGPGDLQIQQQQKQQQQQQQQQQTTQTAQRRVRKPKAKQDIEQLPAVQLKHSEDLGPLVKRETILSRLEHYTAGLFPDSKTRPSLVEIWDSLVGPQASKIVDKKRTITHVELKAMEMIVQHYPQFAYGVVHDNLPVGFYLQETSDNKHVLCYNDDPEYQRKQKARANPLTIQLTEREKPLTGTYQQWIVTLLHRLKPDADEQFLWSALQGKNKQLFKDYPRLKQYQSQFKVLMDPKKPLEDRKEAFLFFIQEQVNDPKIVEDINHQIADLDLNFQGLANLLLSHGELGVRTFLHEMSSLKALGLYTEFNKTFLANTHNYHQFISEKGLANLKTLTSFDSSRRAWWESLVAQHIEAGNEVHFNELFAAYSYFLNELNKIGLNKLPLSCPIKPIKNMQTALDRALYILKNSADSQEQLTVLHGLDLSSTGAYLASRYDDFALVSSEMHLSSSNEIDNSHEFPATEPYWYSLTYIGLGVNPDLLSKNNQAARVDLSAPANKYLYDVFSSFAPDKPFALYRATTPLFKGYILVTYDSKRHEEHVALYDGEAAMWTREVRKAAPIASPKKNSTELNYNPPLKHHLFEATQALGDINDPQNYDLGTVLNNYYRYIGKQDSAYSLSTYQIIARHVLNNEHLSDPEKGYFLSLVAMSTTNNTKSDNPVQDAARLLKALELLDKEYKAQHGRSFIFKYHRISQLRGNQMLSLDQLAQITDFLANTADKKQIDECTDNTFSLILAFDHCADRAFDLLTELRKRERIAEQKITAIDYTGYLNYSSFLGRVIEAFKQTPLNLDQNDRDQLILLLPHLANNFIWNSPRDIHMVMQLAKQLSQLNPQIRTELLAVLSEINIEKSYKLPSIEEISLLIKEVKEKEVDLGQENPAEQRKFFVQAFQRYCPETTLGQEPVNESLMGIVNVFKGYLGKINPQTIIKEQLKEGSELSKILENVPMGSKIMSKLDQWTQPILKAYADLEKLLAQEPVVVEDVLKQLGVIESKAGELIETKLGPIPLKPIFKPIILKMIGESEESAKLEQFLEQKKFLIFIQEPLEVRFKENLDSSIKLLQTGQPELDTFLRSQLAGLDISKPLDKALIEYSNKFDAVNGFINTLIRIRNHQTEDYRKLVKVLTTNNSLQLLSFNQLSQLIHALEKQTQVPVTSQIVSIFDRLREKADCNPERLTIALKQLDVLASYVSLLPAEAYKTLLKASFKYNISAADGAFPLAEMVALKSLATINEQQAEALFDNLMHVIQRVKAEVPEEVVSALIKQIVTVSKDYSASQPQAIILITELLKHCEQYNEQELSLMTTLLTRIPKQHQQEWLQIMASLSTSSHIQNIAVLAEKLKTKERLLPEIAFVFKYRPYPPAERLLSALDKDERELKDFLQQCDKDPKLERADRYKDGVLEKDAHTILTEQFSTGRVHSVVSEIREILAETALNHQQQYDLAQKIIYINAIGKDHPVQIGSTVCNNLTQASREELSQFSKYLINELQKPGASAETVQKDQLKLLAVLREVYFRSTGKFPRTTQMLSLLVSLDNPDNLLMEINTGEGKSITTAMLAVLQWIKGGTVDVCTANRGLVTQDYFTKGTVDFFNFLEIPSAVVKSDSPEKTYKVGGINYSTVADLSLYYARARFEGEDLSTNEEGEKVPCHLILDESDYTTLDDRTLFNYAVGAVGGSDSRINPHAWVYPLINEFIDKPEFRNIDVKNGQVWTKEEDIQRLKIFLDEQAQNPEQRTQLLDLTDKRFDKWLNAACVARQQVKGKSFIIGKETREIDGEERVVQVAVPLVKNNPQPGASFSDGVQQFLQARLQFENPTQVFPIDAEMLFVSTQSAKDFVDHYHSNGRIIGISGTVGMRDELIEQQAKFNMKAMSIPPHEENKRVTLGDYVKKSSETQLAEIKKAIERVVEADKPTQPTLMICKDINQAREMHAHFDSLRYKGKKLTVNVVTGEETEKERDRLIKEAGNPDTITIATSLLGRGTDIDPQHEDGLFVIQCYLDTERTTRQILGRAARNGKVGQYLAIYDANGLPHRHEIGSLLKMSSTERKKALTRLQQQMNAEAAVERHYIQEVAAIQQTLLKQLNGWQMFLEETTDTAALPEVKTKLLNWREELITGLTDRWKQLLEASDPKEEYANLYVRRGPDGKLITAELDQALKAFEHDAQGIWQGIRNFLEKQAQSMNLNEVDQYRLGYLQNISISEELKLRKLEMREQRKANAQEEKNAAIHVRHALDVDGAFLKFSEANLLSKEDKEQYQQRSARTQLLLNIEEFNAIIQKLPVKNKIKELFLIPESVKKSAVLDQVHLIALAFKSFAEYYKEDLLTKFKIQPALIEFLDVFEQLKAWLPQDTSYALVLQEMDSLKKSYVDGVTSQVVSKLQHHLQWAKVRKWDYFLERGAVKEAAEKILKACNDLETAPQEKKQDFLRNLYKVLQKESIKLDSTWTLSLGHRDTKKLIKNTLVILDGMIRIGEVPMSFKNESREEALCDLYLEKFQQVTEQTTKQVKGNMATWNNIMGELQGIQKDTKNLFVLYEMQACLQRHKKDLYHAKSSLVPPVQKLLHQLQHDIAAMERKYPDMISSSQFLEEKQERILANLQQVDGLVVEQVMLKRGHTGFSEYYDLVIKGQCHHSLFTEFTNYNDRFQELNTELGDLRVQYEALNQEQLELESYIPGVQQNLRLMPVVLPLPAQSSLPKEIQEQIKDCNQRINLLHPQWVIDQATGEHIAQLDEMAHRLFTQASKLRDLSFDGLSMEVRADLPEKSGLTVVEFATQKNALDEELSALNSQLKALEDQVERLRQEREARANESRMQKFTMFALEGVGLVDSVESVSRKITALQHLISSKEENLHALEGDFTHHKETILKGMDSLIKDTIRGSLPVRMETLRHWIESEKQKNQKLMEPLQQKIRFLEKEVVVEQSRSGLYAKRFTSIDELFQFNAQIRTAARQQVVAEPDKGDELNSELLAEGSISNKVI